MSAVARIEDHRREPERELPQDAPANIEAEQALLGAALENNDVLHMVRVKLEPEHFFEPLHQKIYASALEVLDAGQIVTPITLRPYLDGVGKIGEMTPFEYLVALRSESLGSFAAWGYVKSIRYAWSRRQMIYIGDGLIKRAYEAPPFADPEGLIAAVADELADLNNACADTRKSRQYADVLLSAVQAVEDREKNPDATIDWFLPELNEVVGAIRPGNLVGFMSDSGGGKTSLSLSQCRYAAERGVPSSFFSIEITEQEAALQMAAQRIGVSMPEMDRLDLLRGKMESLVTEQERAATIPLLIEPFDKADLKLIGASIASLKKRMGLRFVMVDHAKMIELPGAKGDMFAEKVNGLYRGLKGIAKATGVAIVILIQRNSDWKNRENPRPIPSDAYGGGGVVQNLDAMFSIYRPESLYANKLESESIQKKRDHYVEMIARTRGYAWIINHKRRRGAPQLTRRIKFDAPLTLFSSETTQGEKSTELPF